MECMSLRLVWRFRREWSQVLKVRVAAPSFKLPISKTWLAPLVLQVKGLLQDRVAQECWTIRRVALVVQMAEQ
jgi:hypothetical protein